MKYPKQTDLLIAPPNIPDKRFRRSVLMLTHDHRGGSFALCLNHLTDLTLRDIAVELGFETSMNFPIYWGGPVNPNTVWMLHSSDWSCEQTVEINDQWSMTSNVKMFESLADGEFPRHFRFMMGFCSWSRGQLQCELDGLPPWSHNNSWLIAENPGPEWIFEHPVETLWETATTLSSHQAVDSWL